MADSLYDVLSGLRKLESLKHITEDQLRDMSWETQEMVFIALFRELETESSGDFCSILVNLSSERQMERVREKRMFFSQPERESQESHFKQVFRELVVKRLKSFQAEAKQNQFTHTKLATRAGCLRAFVLLLDQVGNRGNRMNKNSRKLRSTQAKQLATAQENYTSTEINKQESKESERLQPRRQATLSGKDIKLAESRPLSQQSSDSDLSNHGGWSFGILSELSQRKDSNEEQNSAKKSISRHKNSHLHIPEKAINSERRELSALFRDSLQINTNRDSYTSNSLDQLTDRTFSTLSKNHTKLSRRKSELSSDIECNQLKQENEILRKMLQEAINDEANLRNESQRSNMTGIQKQRKENENENAVVWRICSILRTKIAYLEYQVLNFYRALKIRSSTINETRSILSSLESNLESIIQSEVQQILQDVADATGNDPVYMIKVKSTLDRKDGNREPRNKARNRENKLPMLSSDQAKDFLQRVRSLKQNLEFVERDAGHNLTSLSIQNEVHKDEFLSQLCSPATSHSLDENSSISILGNQITDLAVRLSLLYSRLNRQRMSPSCDQSLNIEEALSKITEVMREIHKIEFSRIGQHVQAPKPVITRSLIEPEKIIRELPPFATERKKAQLQLTQILEAAKKREIESKQRAQSAEREVQLLRRVRQLEQDTVKQTIKASSNASRDAVKEWNQAIHQILREFEELFPQHVPKDTQSEVVRDGQIINRGAPFVTTRLDNVQACKFLTAVQMFYMAANESGDVINSISSTLNQKVEMIWSNFQSEHERLMQLLPD